MKIVFFRKDNGNPDCLADCELQFTSGPLEGLKLAGISVWRSKFADGGFNVTVPQKKYTTRTGEEKSFNFLRATDNEATMVDFKKSIADAYQRWADAA